MFRRRSATAREERPSNNNDRAGTTNRESPDPQAGRNPTMMKE